MLNLTDFANGCHGQLNRNKQKLLERHMHGDINEEDRYNEAERQEQCSENQKTDG